MLISHMSLFLIRYYFLQIMHYFFFVIFLHYYFLFFIICIIFLIFFSSLFSLKLFKYIFMDHYFSHALLFLCQKITSIYLLFLDYHYILHVIISHTSLFLHYKFIICHYFYIINFFCIIILCQMFMYISKHNYFSHIFRILLIFTHHFLFFRTSLF